MSKEFRTMRAAKMTKPPKFPVFASPKIDGIRVIVRDGKLLSRTLRLIPNQSIQNFLQRPASFLEDGSIHSEMWADNCTIANYLEGLDGEIVVGAATNYNVMQDTMSGVMSKEGEPNWTIYAFDLWNEQDNSYLTRYDKLCKLLDPKCRPPHIRILNQEIIENSEQLDLYEQYCLKLGFEGVMIRNPVGRYKFGCSTETEGYLIKIKRFEDAEAEIIGFNQMNVNENEPIENEMGLTERSTKAEGMVPVNMLGSFIVRTPEGVEFSVSGFTHEEGREFWAVRDTFIGKFAKYKHFANSGVKNAPRVGVFLGFRDPRDT